MRETDEGEVRRGMQLAARLPDIMPDQASERIKPIYEEIQETLRVPIVNLIFRSLANYPDYLEGAWQRLRPALRTRSFERAADRLRAEALLEPVPDASDVRWERTGEIDRIRALEPLADPSRIPAGAAEGTTKVEMVEPEQADERVRALFESVRKRHEHPLVSSYYRGLGNWPDFLDAAWERVRPLVGSDAYEARKGALIDFARDAARDHPVARAAAAELDEAQRGEVRALLAAFRRKFIPEMMLDVALIKALIDGPGSARASRFTAA